MNKKKKEIFSHQKNVVVSIAAAFIAVLLSASVCVAEDINLSIMEIDPWGMFDDKKEPTGLYTDISIALAKEAGFNPVVRIVPYIRVAKEMGQGKSVFCFMTMNDEIKAAANVVDILKPLDFVVVGKKGFSPKNLKELEGKKIGTIHGVYQNKEFDENPKINKEPVKEPWQQMKMLASGRINAIAGVREATYFSLKKIKKEDPTFQIELSDPLILNQTDAYLHISKKLDNEALRNRLKEALKRIKENGTVDKIFNNYTAN